MDYQISVIIPVYNVEKYIKECIDSIVNQTLGIENIEVIIVNDCTPDNSMAIVKEYASKYPSIKIIDHETNQGLGPARNTGIKYATSDYLTFVDSDDFISKNTYETCLNKIIQEKYDLVVYKYVLFSESGKTFPMDIHQEIYKTSKSIENLKEVPEIIFATSACNKIYSKKLFKFLDFPSKLYEDNVVSAEILFNSEKIFVTDECTYFYRQREASSISITKQVSKEKCYDLNDINVQLYELLKVYPEYNELITWLNLNFSISIISWMLNWEFSKEERKEIYNKSKIFLKNISERDIDNFNKYFPDYSIKNRKLIADVRDKSFKLFSIKYENYLPAKKRFNSFKIRKLANIKLNRKNK